MSNRVFIYLIRVWQCPHSVFTGTDFLQLGKKGSFFENGKGGELRKLIFLSLSLIFPYFLSHISYYLLTPYLLLRSSQFSPHHCPVLQWDGDVFRREAHQHAFQWTMSQCRNISEVLHQTHAFWSVVIFQQDHKRRSEYFECYIGLQQYCFALIWCSCCAGACFSFECDFLSVVSFW